VSPPAGLSAILGSLEGFYGAPDSPTPGDPYEFVLFLNAGYPASDENCAKGFFALKGEVWLHPAAILDADEKELIRILRPGGMIPELRARRLKEIALAVRDRLGGDLEGALRRDPARARKLLMKFPTLGEPAAERILLFCGLEPAAAAPAGGLQVMTRLGLCAEDKAFAKTYRAARAAIDAAVPADFAERRRAYLLLKTHGHRLCRRSAPLCDECPLASVCPYALEKAAA
jgi:endonuclease III